MMESRIPEFKHQTFDGMTSWPQKMPDKNLLFHPDDTPSDITTISTDKQSFTESECKELKAILDTMFMYFDDKVYEAAYPVFMERINKAA